MTMQAIDLPTDLRNSSNRKILWECVLFFGAFTWWLFGIRYADMFYAIQDDDIFLYDRFFAASQMLCPAGLHFYGTSFLIQFFYYPGLGGAIHGLGILLLWSCVPALWRRRSTVVRIILDALWLVVGYPLLRIFALLASFWAMARIWIARVEYIYHSTMATNTPTFSSKTNASSETVDHVFLYPPVYVHYTTQCVILETLANVAFILDLFEQTMAEVQTATQKTKLPKHFQEALEFFATERPEILQKYTIFPVISQRIDQLYPYMFRYRQDYDFPKLQTLLQNEYPDTYWHFILNQRLTLPFEPNLR